MAKMTGGQALAKSLYREGVRVVFGLPGAGQYEAIDGIYEEPEIRYFTLPGTNKLPPTWRTDLPVSVEISQQRW